MPLPLERKIFAARDLKYPGQIDIFNYRNHRPYSSVTTLDGQNNHPRRPLLKHAKKLLRSDVMPGNYCCYDNTGNRFLS